MAYLGRGKKCDLIKLATELGEAVPTESTRADLKEIITKSKNYDEPFVKELLTGIIDERINEVIREEELKKIESDRAFELEKLKIESQNKIISQTGSNVHVPEVNKNSIDLRNLMQKFDLKDGDIASFLILFERQAKRIGLKESDYVTYLLGLLPLEITQLIARESEQEANEYIFVKNLLLKRYKLSPESFRQKFASHVKDLKGTWTDFVFELRTYFNEWITGLSINDFESLKELMITDQLKKRVPNMMREHFIDSWPKFVKANDLAEKLDEYENVRSGIKTNNESKNTKYTDYCEDSKYFPHSNYRMSNRNSHRFDSTKFENKNVSVNKSKANEKEIPNHKVFSSSIRNEKGEPKCFSCNLYGHISRNCNLPCKRCGESGHVKKFCPKTNETRSENLNVYGNRESMAPDKYLRRATINKKSVSVLLDTGSSSCLMKLSVAKRLGLNISPCKKDLYSFGNQINPVSQSLGVAIVDLEIDDVMARDVTVLIVSDSTQPVDLLIGRTFLDLPYIAYARVGENLHIGYAKDYPFVNLECIEENPTVKLKVTETEQIENNSINFVRAKTEDLNDGLIMIRGEGENLDSLLEVKEGETIVPVINTRDRKIILNRNQNVGKAELVDDDNLKSYMDSASFVNEAQSLEPLDINTSVEREPITLEQIKFDEPKNIYEVKRFLGLTGFFRRFVSKYAEKAEPLTRLTKKNQDFEWKEEQKNAFRALKEILTNQPILAHYDPTFETEVHTDASSNGLSGMLLQRGDDEKWHLVYCVSKKTTDVEKNYHSSKLELMAIIWTLDRLRQYLLGIKFTIVTDCQALIYMNSKKTTNPQIARWYDLIQEFDMEVKHRPGTKMSHVDAMSRAPVSDPEDTLTSIIERNLEVCLTLSEEEQVLIIQHTDSELKKLIDIFRKKEYERTVDEKQKVCNYVFKGNKLYRRVKEKEKEKLLYVIPKSMRKSTAVKFHDLMGHFSVDRTANKIRELYWFPYMKRYLRRHISMCFECLMNKVPGGKQQGYLHPIKPGKRPFSLIHMDHLGPFVRSSRRNQDLLVIIDNFTRFTRLFPVKNTSSQHVIKALKNFVEEFGLPDRIVSDRGTCFTSRQFEQYCQDNGIRHTLNSTQHPQGNGMVERANRTILSTITTSMKDQRHKDWDVRIKETERNLNNVVNKTTDKTPFEMLHGYSPRFTDGILRKVADADAEKWEDPKEIQEKTRKEIEKKQQKMKEDYDKKRCRTMTYEPGEIVVVRRPPKSSGEPTKTQPKYRGPLIITETLPNDTYRVTQLEEKQKGRFYTTTAHVSQLKPWPKPKYEDEDDDDSDNEESSTELSEPP